jgi:hypothetical protein
MDRTKTLKARRKSLRMRRMKRIEVTVRNQDAQLIRRVAAQLRHNDANATRLRSLLRGAAAEQRGPTLAQALYDPVVASPDYDAVFDEIERFRRHPEVMKFRDLDL